ncbi:ABC-2 type transporter [Micromonospora nigra]|uniref:Transport permease protein n=1 Tax=Micromonospora nigra TaxID=145857 RepID=A0A1C6T0U2_9ACTN|nr:ABC transporter ATP-binding protein/permease [Micromonospora nigra]SCL35444.1 ABC-2 type transporter [Micromonospora nigra]
MLQIRQAARWFGRLRIFGGLDLEVAAGNRLFLGGPNGSGKTTLLRCLAGTLALDSGRATVDGHPVGSSAARQLTGVCLAPEHRLYEKLSAHQNIAFVARLRLPWRVVRGAVARVEEELDIVGYAAVPVERCSAGMRARVSVARALVGTPALLLLDEPGRSLDEHARGLLWQALDRRSELTVVVASHQTDDRSRCQQELTLTARMTPPTRTDRPSTDRAGAAGRPSTVGLAATVLALVRRDLGERHLLRWPLLLDFVFGVVNLVVYLFISRVLTPSTDGGFPSASYFDFVAAGLTFMLVVQAATSQLTSRVSREQRSGTLELLAAQPLPVGALAVGLAGYPFLFALLRAAVYLLVLGTLLGLPVARAHWWAVAALLLVGGAAMMSVGIALAAIAVVVGHGDAIARLAVVGLSFLSGTYFPVTALPGVLPELTVVLPSRLALDGLRGALSGGPWAMSVLTLLAATALLLPMSILLFHRALAVAARRGTLTRE